MLSHSFSSLLESRDFRCVSVPRGFPKSTHLSYADDILIFSSTCPTSLRGVMQTIEVYKAVSSQKINAQKCCFLVHEKLPSRCVARVWRVTVFAPKSFPVCYLGYLLFSGRRKSMYFMELVQSVINKISSWRSRCLSSRRHVILIKHVLLAILIHLLTASSPLKGVLALVELAMANFLWGGRENGPRHHWIKWQDLCANSSQGGIGVHSLLEVHSAFSIKLWWRFRTSDCLWSTFMHAKYC